VDNILDVAIKYKQDLENDCVIEQKDIPCSGVFFNRQSIFYTLCKDQMLLRTRNSDIEEGLMYIILSDYFHRTPNHNLGLEVC
jgi:hypothetical protein